MLQAMFVAFLIHPAISKFEVPHNILYSLFIKVMRFFSENSWIYVTDRVLYHAVLSFGFSLFVLSLVSWSPSFSHECLTQ